MLAFCPNCGQTPEQEQAVGQTVICRYCGNTLGTIATAPKPIAVDRTEELIRQGVAARCPVCQQAVDVKVRGTLRSLVPHAAKGEPRKVCPGGGKALPAPTKEDEGLRAFMTKDVIAVIRCGKGAEPTIEELTLEYLDKADRVRLQIDALREMLGASFQMRDYPVNQPHLAVWANSQTCVIAKKHPQGGYQAMTTAEITQVLTDLRQSRPRFFG